MSIIIYPDSQIYFSEHVKNCTSLQSQRATSA